VRHRLILAALAVFVLGAVAEAHLCNNIYRTPDRIIVKPEKDTSTLETGDTFRIFIRNNYPTMLNNVRLLYEMDAAGVQATITPESFAHLVPGEKQAFSVAITAAGNAAQGRHAMKLTIGADNIGFDNAGFVPVGNHSADEIARTLEDGNWSARVMGAESLARMGDQRGIDELQRLIAGNDPRGIRAAGMSGNKDCAALLIPVLQNPDGRARGTAVLSLGLLGVESDRIAAMGSDTDPFVQTAAHTAYVIGVEARPDIADWLATQLGQGDAWVRCAAAWGAAWCDKPGALEALDECFRSGDADLVVFAGDALISLANKQEAQAGAAAPGPAAEVTPDGTRAFTAAIGDRLNVKPILPIESCADGGVIRIQVAHTYPGPLHNVRVTVEGEGVDVLDAGEAIAALKPTQQNTIELRVKATPKAGAEVTPAVFTVTADEIEKPTQYTFDIPATEAAAKVANLNGTTEVGTVEVRVMRFGDYYGLLFAVPLALIVGTVFWRWRKQSQP
jgi:hypothetical protein